MNPLLDQEMIDAELAADRESASSEWLGRFRSSTVQFLDDELIEAAIVLGCRERPFERRDYFSFTDPSSGRHDAFTFSTSHRDGALVVQDRLLIEPASLNSYSTPVITTQAAANRQTDCEAITRIRAEHRHQFRATLD